MSNPHQHDLANIKVRVRCPDCRRTFHEWLPRVARGDRVVCSGCHNEMHFHGIGDMHAQETVADYIHRVEGRTCHPHFSVID